jgi:RNA polymerase sigma factor for flagellar operon FliA
VPSSSFPPPRSYPPAAFPAEPKTDGSHRRALEKELLQYDPLVRKIARRILGKLPPNVQEEDLIAAGRLGLWELLKRTPERNSNFLMARIRGAILDELRAQDWLTRRQRAGLPHVSKIGIDDLVVSEWERMAPRVHPPSADLMDRRMVQLALSKLSPRDQSVLRAFFVGDIPMTIIAARMRVSPPRVSQLIDRALGRLRDVLEGGAGINENDKLSEGFETDDFSAEESAAEEAEAAELVEVEFLAEKKNYDP